MQNSYSFNISYRSRGLRTFAFQPSPLKSPTCTPSGVHVGLKIPQYLNPLATSPWCVFTMSILRPLFRAPTYKVTPLCMTFPNCLRMVTSFRTAIKHWNDKYIYILAILQQLYKIVQSSFPKQISVNQNYQVRPRGKKQAVGTPCVSAHALNITN